MTIYSDEQINALIDRHFPSKCVYADEFKKLPSILNAEYLDLRSYCKSKGFDNILQWLNHKGLYRNVEKDMRQGALAEFSQSDTAVDIARKAFSASPLVGDIILNDDQFSCVMKYAQDVFDHIQMGLRHTRDDDVVLVFAIILMLRRNNSNENDAEAEDQENDSFWSYIYRQFGYKIEDSLQSVYAALRTAVTNALNDNIRYIAPSKSTQRYYTSLMLHALAPVSSMESLFEILLYFYTDELNYDYVPGDPAFIALTNCVAYRWDKTVEASDDIHIRSNIMASGLRILFQDRPVFMSGFCDMLTKKIDALVRNQGDTILNPLSYLDSLLNNWYKKKEAALREKLHSNKTLIRAGRHADSIARVRIGYAFEADKVGILIPGIRLEYIADEEPVYELYQDGELLSSGRLDVYGRLCWTVRQYVIDVSSCLKDFKSIDGLELKIIYDGKTLIDTGKSLFRTCIVFDKNGREIPRQSMGKGQYYLFAGNGVVVQYTEDSEVYQMNHPGQLLSLLFSENSSVCVNGIELISTRQSKSSFHHYTSVDRVAGAFARYGGDLISIYPSAPEIRFTLPVGNSPLQYHVFIDDDEYALSEICKESQKGFSLDAPGDNQKVHVISLADCRNSEIVYEYRYVVLDHLSYVLEKEVYFDNGEPITGYIQYGDTLYQFDELAEEDEDKILISIDELEYEIEIDIPLVRCKWNDNNLLKANDTIWHESVSKNDFVVLLAPLGWYKYLMIGGNQIPLSPGSDSLFEFGNYLNTFKGDNIVSLYIVLQRSGSKPISYHLMDIAFSPVFGSNMLQIDENNGLYWMPVGNALCNSMTTFRLQIHISSDSSEDYVYSLKLKNERLCREFPYNLGIFPYEIYMEGKKNVFKKEPDVLIETGSLQFGSEHEIRLIGKMIRLTKAKCVNFISGKPIPENIIMNANAGWLTDFQYCGETNVPYENVVAPMFTATLCFFDPIGRVVRSFNSNQRSDLYELINPVSVWLINDHVLLLQTVTEDAVSIDKRYSSIVNRKPVFSSKKEELERIRIPDTFEYELMEEYNV